LNVLLCNGDVNRDGIVLGVPVVEGAVVPGTVVLCFPNGAWMWSWYSGHWHGWSRWLRLDHSRCPAAASPDAVA
jgi:hypothetical protein